MDDASMGVEQGLSKGKTDQEQKLIVPKTPEQLKRQAVLVNVHRSLSDYDRQPIPFPPELLETTPQGLKAILDTERKRVALQGGRSELLDNYSSFLKSLRKVRQEQRPQVSKVMREATGLISGREAYLKSVSFSSPLQDKILEKIQGGDRSGFSSLSRLFTDEQIQSAKENEEAFLGLVNYGLRRSPEFIFNAFEQLEMLLPKEKIRSVLDVLIQQQPFRFIQQFDKIYKYYELNERKDVILKANGVDVPFRSAIFLYFDMPEISQLFSKEEGRELLLSSSATLYEGAIEKNKVDAYVKEGFLTETDVRNIIIGLIQRKSDGIKKVGEFMQYFPEDQRDILKQEVFNAFTRQKNKAYLHELGYTKDLLTDDDKRSIIRHCMQNTTPDMMVFHLDMMIQFLPEDEVRVWLKDGIKKNVYPSSHGTKTIIQGDILSPEEKLDFLQKIINEHPGLLLDDLELYLTYFPADQRPTLVRQIVENIPVSIAISNLNKWILYIGDNPQEQKEFITNLILKENGFTFVSVYNNRYGPNNLLKKLYTQQEIKDFISKQIQLGAEGVFDYLKDILEIFGSDSEFKVFINRAAKYDPYALFYRFGEVSYLYTTEELRELVDRTSQDSRGVSVCIASIDEWGSILGKDYTWSFIQRFRFSYTPEITHYLSKCWHHIPEAQRPTFLHDLLISNPPNALCDIDIFNLYLKDLTPEEIIDKGQSDQERLAYAPKTLSAFYKNIAKVKDVSERRALLQEATEWYLYIAQIEAVGLGSDFKRIQSAKEIPARLEHELLSLFECYALIKDKDPQSFARLGSLGNNAYEAKQILLEELGRRLGITRKINEEEIGRLFGELESPAPFLIYLFQYESSQEHKQILSGMLESILAGKYNEWKFGPQNPEAFEELKKAKLLPKDLAYEQYDTWRKDEETTLYESLAADVRSVASEIRQLLFENNEHLEVEAFSMADTTPQAVFEEIQNNLSSAGQELASVNKRMSELRKTAGGTESEEFKELSNKRLNLEEIRRELLKNRAFMKLSTLKPEEIVSGYFLEGEDLKKKVAPIKKVLDELRPQIPEEGIFVLERIDQLIQSFYDQTQEKQNLTCTDSSSPKVLIEIGEKPVGSCQHYAHGSLNDCLLGYSDPNTKILILANERGNPVARSIFRLLTTSHGKPALHIERIYSSTASQGVLLSIYTHAYRKAKEMGIPLLVSQESQNEQGVETGIQVPAGFDSIPVEYVLVSGNSRAPKVYVDSAGGERSRGNYKMDNLLEVKAITM